MENNNRGGGRSFGGNRDGGSRFGGGGFKKGGFGGNRGGGRSFGGDREVTMHDAVCADCHKPCQVPFRPTNDRPVYCKDCFTKNGGLAGKSRSNDLAKKDFGNKPQFNSSFKPQADSNFSSNSEVKKQLEALNIKIDSLIRTVEAMKPVKVEVKETVKSVKKAKTVKAKKTK
ncbi:MAG: CxxC-x17-CxxC domain-containing protein [Candidatus Paceibacterota bacterium]